MSDDLITQMTKRQLEAMPIDELARLQEYLTWRKNAVVEAPKYLWQALVDFWFAYRDAVDAGGEMIVDDSALWDACDAAEQRMRQFAIERGSHEST